MSDVIVWGATSEKEVLIGIMDEASEYTTNELLEVKEHGTAK
jgi:hypothetical protein